MDDVWCSLDIAGLQSALAADPLWQPFPDSAVSSIGGDSNAYFGVADVDLMLSSPDEANNGMATDMDAAGCFFGDDDDGGRFLFQHSSTSSSLSSKRSLSIDSGGSSGSFTLEASPYQAPAPAMAHLPSFPGGDHDDEAIMRAMMAVMSASASPSSSASPSASSRPPHPFRRDSSGSAHQGQAAAAMPQKLGGGNGGHVVVKSSLAMSPPEKTQEEPRAAGGNSGQLYHMMSERKRREKLNDSFHTLRSLLPPCSKKDKTTVLTKAAGYLKALEAQVWELEEKNGKLERHIPACSQRQEAPAGQQNRRAKVQISRSDEVVNLTVMVMVECDVVELVLRLLECLRWMEQISVLSVDADTYSPKVLLKAIASIKLRITDGCDWNEASFHEAMTKAVNDATSSPPTTTTSLRPCARVPLVVTA